MVPEEGYGATLLDSESEPANGCSSGGFLQGAMQD
jgi:hypothetical protein